MGKKKLFKYTRPIWLKKLHYIPDDQFPRSLAKSLAQLYEAVTQRNMVLFQNTGLGFNFNITVQ